MADQLRQCTICTQRLPLDQFYRCYSTKDGYGPYCKKCNAAKRKQWRERNRDRANLQSKKYALEKPEQRRKWLKTYCLRNVETIRQKSAQHRISNPESHRASERRRRAAIKQRTKGGTKEIQQLYDRCASDEEIPCFYCGQRTKRGCRNVEHKTPVIRGGEHSPENLVIACIPCNAEKFTRTAEEFKKEV